MMSVLPTLSHPTPTAEELALKEQVTQVLTSQGVLAKLKAELRAAVFEVMHEREGFAKTNDPTVPKLSDFPIETRTMALALIAECLQFFHWEHALRVLLAETNAEDEQYNTARIVDKLGLTSSNSSVKPALFQLIESRVLGSEQSAVSVASVTTLKRGKYDDEGESGEETTVADVAAPAVQPYKRDANLPPAKESDRIEAETEEVDKDEGKEEEAESSAEIEESMAEEVPSGSELEESNFTNYEDEESQDYCPQVIEQPTDLYSEREQGKFPGDDGQDEGQNRDTIEYAVLKLERIEAETKEVDKDEGKEEEAESSAEIEESMAEEVPSGSELEESNFTNYENEESQDYRPQAIAQPTDLYSERQQGKFPGDDGQDEGQNRDDESNDEDSVSLAAPPPAPAKLPSLPPLVGTSHGTNAGDTEDDFDAEEEAERLRKLDAALQAMEAEDDTGTLQQLKKSLQMELQEQDSLVSSGGIGKAEEDNDAESEPPANKSQDDQEGDDDGYGSSDFEEEDEIASEISEEMESMPELSDKEDESEDGAATSAAEIGPPSTLRNDTRVDSEDALNSYDYIEEVEKGGW
ncbi:FGFR1 oncogene [Phytophthora cinnamomi]|uniref:FGFR1 oncogene n=1 Tax=Phytophthora cinnamomi TaxID=4785 RepID=UPI00355AAC1A|nr:FGFR1 oncogene [Phytophthora cinnamomi]